MTYSAGSVAIDPVTAVETKSGAAELAYDSLGLLQPEMMAHDNLVIRLAARGMNADFANAIVAPLADRAVSGVQVHTHAIGQLDLVGPTGLEVVTSSTALPANARVIGVELSLSTPFSGGGATSVELSVGDGSDPVALIKSADVSASVDGQALNAPRGNAPNKKYLTARSLTYRFVVVGGTTAGLTAGLVSIDTIFVEHSL